MNHYLNVFLEAASSASLIPFAPEATFYAMKAFGSYPMPAAVALAVAGAVSMQAFNWAIGAWLSKRRKPNGWYIPDTAYEKAKRLFNRYGIFLLFFCWAVGGNMLVAVSGFLGVRVKTALPLILAGYTAYYGFAVLG